MARLPKTHSIIFPDEKFNAYKHSGHTFFVESGKVYAVKNETVCIGSTKE